MANLSTILADIRQNVIDLPSDTEARLVGWVNEAQIVAEAHFNWKGTETSLVKATTLGVVLLDTLPTNWIVAIGDPWYRTGDGVTVGMEWIPSEQDVFKDHTFGLLTTDRGRPIGLQETASSILVYPPPDANNTLGVSSAAGEYEIVIPYRKREEKLSAGGTTSNFFTTDPDLSLHIIDYASGKAMLFNRDFNNGQLFLTTAQAHLLRAKRLDKKRKSQFMKFTPRRDVFASRRQRRAI